MNDVFEMITLYVHPSDFPWHVVARPWMITKHDQYPKFVACLYDDIETARADMLRLGLTVIGRKAYDDPAILETWL